MAKEQGTAEAVQQVKQEQIRLAVKPNFWSKNTSEDQRDAMGYYQHEVSLVLPGQDGSETVIPIQQKGQPATTGGKLTVPTIQRQVLKVLVATVETYGTQKGSGFAATFALNLKANATWLQKLAKQGYYLAWEYGVPGSKGGPAKRYVALLDVLAFAGAAANMDVSTLERYPPSEAVATVVASSEPTLEEVAFTL